MLGRERIGRGRWQREENRLQTVVRSRIMHISTNYWYVPAPGFFRLREMLPRFNSHDDSACNIRCRGAILL